MIWPCCIIIGLGVGSFMRFRGERIVSNLAAGVLGAIIGGIVFQYILQDIIAVYTEAIKWGFYISLLSAFIGAILIVLVKRIFLWSNF